MVMLPFEEWAPDRYPGSSGASPLAENVVPTLSGYYPIKGASPADAEQIPELYEGVANRLWYEVAQDRQVFTFLATDQKLYRLNNGLNDVTRLLGGNYTPIGDPGSRPWQSVAFGDTVLAVNGYDQMQSLDMGGGVGNFTNTDTNPRSVAGASSDLTGRYIAVIGDIAVLGHVRDQGTGEVWANRVHWSALNDPTDYAPDPATQADFQDIPDLGEVRGVTGGEYGLVLMERGVVRMDYVGPPTYFRFDVIKEGDGIGCDMPQTVVKVKAGTIFHAQHGWFACDGQSLAPIGDNKIDRWWKDKDVRAEDALRISAASLPDLHCVGWLYVSKSAPGYATGHPMQDGTLANDARIPNKILLYNIDENRWSVALVQGEVLGNGASDTSIVLDALGDGELPPNNSGDGPYPGGPEAGPAAGLDTPGFPSLDSAVWKGLSGAVGGIWKQPDDAVLNRGSLHIFEGTTLTARVDTAEIQPIPGYRARATRAVPLVEGSEGVVKLTSITRVKHAPTQDASMRTYEESPSGIFRMRSEGRFHRMRVEVAGSWQRLWGVDVDFVRKGRR